jgi:intracellular septation protein
LKLDPPSLWTRLNTMWIFFFVVVGALNLYVAFNFSEAAWVNFKLFGLLGLTLVFALVQGLWLARKTEQLQPGPVRPE